MLRLIFLKVRYDSKLSATPTFTIATGSPARWIASPVDRQPGGSLLGWQTSLVVCRPRAMPEKPALRIILTSLAKIASAFK